MVGLDTTQYVLFSSSINLKDKVKLASQLNEKTNGIFDGDPTILPLADDVPPEFPRMQLKSREDTYRLAVAKNRLDFVIVHRNGTEKTEFPEPKSVELFVNIFQLLSETLKAQISRAALVNNWAIQLDANGAEYLRNKFILKDSPISNLQEMEIHYLQKLTVAGLESNKWVRIKSARKATDPDDRRIITVQMDINSLSEKEYNFSVDSLKTFIAQSANLMNVELHQHFPEEANAN